MVASSETIEQIRSRFDLPKAVEHCLSSAMTVAYFVAAAEPELFDKMEFWQAETDNGSHLYIALPIGGKMQTFNQEITWPNDKYPDYDYDSLRRNGVPVNRVPIDLFVKSALEGGPEMKRLIDLITKPEKLLEFEESL